MKALLIGLAAAASILVQAQDAAASCSEILSIENLTASINEDWNPNPVDNFASIEQGKDGYGSYYAMNWVSPKPVDLTLHIPADIARGSSEAVLVVAASEAMELQVYLQSSAGHCGQKWAHFTRPESIQVTEHPQGVSISYEGFALDGGCVSDMSQSDWDQLTSIVLFAPGGSGSLRIYSAEFPGGAWAASDSGSGSDTDWLDGVHVLVGQTSDETLLPLDPTVLGWANNYVPGYQCSLITWAKSHGMHFVSSLSFWDDNTTTSVGQLPAGLRGATCIDIDGNVMMRGEPDQSLVWMSTAAPEWQASIRDFAIAEVDRGVDGFVLDEFMGNIVPLYNGGTFDESSLRGFRDYLREEYTAGELSTRFSILDVGRFDYREYLLEMGLRDVYLNTPWACPLWEDYFQYQEQVAIDAAVQLIAELDVYALARDRDISFSANAYEMGVRNLWTASFADYMTFEHQYLWPEHVDLIRETTLPFQWSATPQLKLAQAITDYRPVAMLSIPDFYYLAELGTATAYDLLNLFIAEAYAAGGSFLHFNIDVFEAPPERIAPTFRLFTEQADLLKGSESVAKIAVLYSHPTAMGLGDMSYRGACLMLSHLALQFDVLFSGYGRQGQAYNTLERDISAAELSEYEVVVLPGTALMTDQQVSLLVDYLQNGGRVITWDTEDMPPGSLTAQEAPASRSEWRSMLAPGSPTIGSGALRYFQGRDLGTEYYSAQSKAALRDFEGSVSSMAAPIVTVDSRGVMAFALWNDEKETLAISLVNPILDPITKRVTTQEAVTVIAEWPDASVSGTIHATLHNPSEQSEVVASQLEAVLRGGHVSITIPEVPICSMLILGVEKAQE